MCCRVFLFSVDTLHPPPSPCGPEAYLVVGRAAKRASVATLESARLETQLLAVAPSTAKGGNVSQRKLPLWSLQKIAFSHNRKACDLADQYNVSRTWILAVFPFMAAAYLQAQLIILGCLVAKAALEAPSCFGWRLAWDETGQKLTVQMKDSNDQLTVHLMVARLRQANRNLVWNLGRRFWIM